MEELLNSATAIETVSTLAVAAGTFIVGFIAAKLESYVRKTKNKLDDAVYDGMKKAFKKAIKEAEEKHKA